MKFIALSTIATTAALLSACATGGPVSGGSNARGSMPFSKEEYAKDPAAYSKKFAKSAGDDSAYGVYKKVIVPTYVIQFQQNYALKADSNLAEKFILKKQDALFVNVGLDVEKHKVLLQEITDASYKRFVKKLKDVGVEVVDVSTLENNKDYKEFWDDHLATGPEAKDGIYKVPATGTGRLTTYMGMGALGFTRDVEMGIVAPNWYVGFGHAGGGQPHSTKIDFKGLEVEFTPEISAGGNANWLAKYHPGDIRFSSNVVSPARFSEGFEAGYDNRADKKAAESGRAEGAANARNIGMAANGGYTQGYNASDFVVSSVATANQSIKINPAKFKEEVLAQLDHVEDIYLNIYKTEL